MRITKKGLSGDHLAAMALEDSKTRHHLSLVCLDEMSIKNIKSIIREGVADTEENLRMLFGGFQDLGKDSRSKYLAAVFLPDSKDRIVRNNDLDAAKVEKLINLENCLGSIFPKVDSLEIISELLKNPHSSVADLELKNPEQKASIKRLIETDQNSSTILSTPIDSPAISVNASEANSIAGEGKSKTCVIC